MLETIMFSIVIVNYNNGCFLEDALLSVFSQSYQDFELIVVDGGSTDDSVQIIEKYAEKLAWWCSEKDKGQSDAFNKGFSKAKGLWGCWLNADDIFINSHALEHIRNYLCDHPDCEWCSANTIFLDAELKVMKCCRNSNVSSRFHQWLPGTVIGAPSSFFLLSRLREVNGFDDGLHFVMDIDLWRKFFLRGMQLWQVSEYIWGFRVHESSKTSHSITQSKSESFYRESILLRSRYKYNRIKISIGKFLYYGLKMLTFNFFLAKYDTCRYRGTTHRFGG